MNGMQWVGLVLAALAAGWLLALATSDVFGMVVYPILYFAVGIGILLLIGVLG